MYGHIAPNTMTNLVQLEEIEKAQHSIELPAHFNAILTQVKTLLGGGVYEKNAW